MTELLAVCGTGIAAVFSIIIIRELKKEYTPVILAAVCLLFTLYILPKINESVAFLQELSVYLENTHADKILRALGITYLTCTASDLCRSAGEAAVGNYIELAGRLELLLLCIPLFRELTELALL